MAEMRLSEPEKALVMDLQLSYLETKISQGELHVVYSVVTVVLRRVVGVAPAEAPVPLLSHVGAVELLHPDVGVPHVGVVLVEPEVRLFL